MTAEINFERRRLFGIAVLGTAAVEFGLVGSARAATSNVSTPASSAASHTSFATLRSVRAGDLEIGYAEAGPQDGPVALLLHGWPYDIHSYADVAPILAAEGYRVVVPHLRGYGTTRFLSSATPRNGQQSALAVDMIALMDALGINSAIIAGYDWGARTADIMAALWPERCRALVSVSGYLIILCTWLAVRLATRPLAQLASAADALDPNRKGAPMSEEGPSEVAHAARAFNALRERIAHYLEERVQILAAISHDLQTPITRMKLRAEMADESTEKDKLIRDLGEIERLVQDGIAYARSAHGNVEKVSRIDIGSFVESIVYDYQDTGKAVAVISAVEGTVQTKPHALRRILSNFIDNALKFAGSAEITVDKRGSAIAITVMDSGPGIPEDQLEAAMQPFYRLEQSRNRETGGAGLGLAIAQQLATAIGGSIRLYNRKGGGLAAEVVVP